MCEIYRQDEKKITFLDKFDVPRIFINKHPKSGKAHLDVGRQTYKRVPCRHGVVIHVFTSRDELGRLRQGVKVESTQTHGKILMFF
jgi:hypothetical protein